MPSMREPGQDTGDRSEPLPHDLPDQQAGSEEDGPDRWDVPDVEQPDSGTPGDDIPDADEAGAGRRGDPAPDSPSPSPEPQESPG